VLVRGVFGFDWGLGWRFCSMAKMFYTLDEAAAKLGRSADEVRRMADSGQLQEFRDGDRLMFKVDQVDLMSGGDDEVGAGGGGMIPLADGGDESGMGLSLEDSGPGGYGLAGEVGSGGGGGGAKERSGISIFDEDDLGGVDTSADTLMTDATTGDLTMDSVGGSGSGLLDLTQESDDTSLGADLLGDVYAGDEELGVASQTQASSGLFETTGAASDVSPGVGGGVAAYTVIAPVEGGWSGLTGGLALGTVLVVLLAGIALVFSLVGAPSNPVAAMMSGNLMMWLGIFAAVVLVPGVVGFLIGRKS